MTEINPPISADEMQVLRINHSIARLQEQLVTSALVSDCSFTLTLKEGEQIVELFKKAGYDGQVTPTYGDHGAMLSIGIWKMPDDKFERDKLIKARKERMAAFAQESV